ncbi:hypothetical protein [Alicyclobacillus acidiphilus]|uniref:hypothetical protein n=1 Tax=Alicyclobacillus acidiphilus TaxID=182455 RepID=UPI0012EEC9A0|nr:hypothetical protein [Alicyclobacillus acidiphilus]
MAKITRIFEASIEEQGDYIFTPSGVVLLLHNGNFLIYSESARHNFLRRTCMRHGWDDLVEGVREQGLYVRIRDVTNDVQKRLDPDTWSVEAVLDTWYSQNPRQLFFLQRYSSSPSQTNIPPR